jgi:hypothetical protein
MSRRTTTDLLTMSTNLKQVIFILKLLLSFSVRDAYSYLYTGCGVSADVNEGECFVHTRLLQSGLGRGL